MKQDFLVMTTLLTVFHGFISSAFAQQESTTPEEPVASSYYDSEAYMLIHGYDFETATKDFVDARLYLDYVF